MHSLTEVFLKQRKPLVGTSHLGDNIGWRLSLGLTGLPAVLVLAGCLVLPETPNSLMQQGNEQEARKVGHSTKLHVQFTYFTSYQVLWREHISLSI